MLSAYPFDPTESHVGEGAIEVTGEYRGRRPPTPEAPTAEETTSETPESGTNHA